MHGMPPDASIQREILGNYQAITEYAVLHLCHLACGVVGETVTLLWWTEDLFPRRQVLGPRPGQWLCPRATARASPELILTKRVWRARAEQPAQAASARIAATAVAAGPPSGGSTQLESKGEGVEFRDSWLLGEMANLKSRASREIIVVLVSALLSAMLP